MRDLNDRHASCPTGDSRSTWPCTITSPPCSRAVIGSIDPKMSSGLVECCHASGIGRFHCLIAATIASGWTMSFSRSTAWVEMTASNTPSSVWTVAVALKLICSMVAAS